MAAITLLEALSLHQPQLRGAVINTLVQNVPLMDKIKWENTKQLNVTTSYLSGIPTVGFRSLNEAPGETKAAWSQLSETLKILEVDIVIDPVLLMVDTIQNLEAANTEAAIKSIGYLINDKLINGNSASDPEEPDGIKVRLENDARFNGQSVNATGSTTKLDLTAATNSSGNRYAYLDKLDELIAVMGGTNFSADSLNFLCNNQTERANWSFLRREKLLDTTKDQFDRVITAFRGVPFTDVGFKSGAGAITGTFDAATTTTNQIIPNDNDDLAALNGALAYQDSTSIYAVRFGQDFFLGLQMSPLKTKNLGQSADNPHKSRINIQWVFGFGAFQKRSIGRLVGLDIS